MAELDYDHFDGGYPAAASGHRFGRFAHLGGAALSVALVISGAVWAYQLAVRDVAGVPVIRAVVDPMRLAPSNPGGSQTLHQGLSVNAVAAAGTALPLPETLTLAPRPMELAEEDQAGLEPLVRGLRQRGIPANIREHLEVKGSKNNASVTTFKRIRSTPCSIKIICWENGFFSFCFLLRQTRPLQHLIQIYIIT